MTRRERMVDRIELSAIRALGTIGVLPEEQARAQPFEVDVVIELDVSEAGRTDDLDKTVNYASAISMVTNVIENENTLLLERVATRIAEDILTLDQVNTVEVVVRKLRPPVPEDILSTGVRIVRSRADVHRRPRIEHTAYIALGSNLGDRVANLRFGVLNLPGVTAVSGVYETEPVGGPEQGPYLNVVARIETTQDPFELLESCLAIESGAGRERTIRWGARTLDLDVLLWGDATISSHQLTIPHPRMWERRFVLQPLNDLAPELLPEDWDRRLPAGGIIRVDDLAL